MKLLKTLVLSASLSLSAVAAHAENFNFSYTFDDGQSITGSFSGLLDGLFVDNVSNIHAAFNGVAFSGPLFSAGFDAVNSVFSGNAVISFDASKNNFIFSNSTNPQNFDMTNYFAIVTSGPGASVIAVGDNFNTVAADIPGATAGQWSLTAVPVPEPETYAMLLAGLGVLGAVTRRRRQSV